MSESDQSFTGLSAKFAKNIYGTSKGRLRLAVLARDLEPWRQQDGLKILDVGAGLGQLTMPFARAGHHITHTDIASEMVDQAQQLHQQNDLAEQYNYHVAALQELPQLLAEQQFDLIICHAVLEWLAEPKQAIATLLKLLAPQGTLSLMFYNQDAKRLANIIYGNFDYVQKDMQVKNKVRLSPQQPLAPEQVEQWVDELGLRILQRTGVRCFHDYLREREHQQRFAELLELELQFNQQQPYIGIGRYQHWLLERQQS